MIKTTLFNAVITVMLGVILSMSCAKTVQETVIPKPEIIHETTIIHDTIVQTKIVDCKPILVSVSVYFSFDSDILSDESKYILDKIKNIDAGVLTVVGSTDPVGDFGYNHWLGMRRAKAVYNYLGLSEPHIITSIGETTECPDYSYCRKVTVSND